MAELVPLPIGRLLTRMFRELESHQRIFDLPAERFFLGDPQRDLSVAFHEKRAATPLGPAAGPHTQLAQNIVLSFLGGARILELKTVQINDQLAIPRPCIDMQTVGYNVEWSQELHLEQSLEEYVKAAMLIEMLRASGKLAFADGAGAGTGISAESDRAGASSASLGREVANAGRSSAQLPIFDLSVGYDLAGIQSERVRAFLDGMLDARAVIDRLRPQIPAEFAHLRDLDFPTRIADSLTLSTFHGCPPDEIERMLAWLIADVGLHGIVKLNPTLLGPVDARRLLNRELGYPDHVPDEAFAKDTTWSQAVDFVGRLDELARSAGRGFGVKFSNTLIVENRRSFFPASEKVMYLSGPPLHVLAMNLVARFREVFGDRIPISFSAGIDRRNFADAVALGLVPVTVCSDLLRTGGYARMKPYFTELCTRMEKCGARTIDEWIVLGHGNAASALAALDGLDSAQLAACSRALEQRGDLPRAAGEPLWRRWVSAAKLANTRSYVPTLAQDARYTAAGNTKTPPKVGSRLDLFDCLTCDKCIPVCPNDAIFTYELEGTSIPIIEARPRGDGTFECVKKGELKTEKRHQIAIFADFCNECGNCDVFCPEDGGPYAIKPRFFGSLAEWKKHAQLDGFFVERVGNEDRIYGRIQGEEHLLSVIEERGTYVAGGLQIECTIEALQCVRSAATTSIDLTWMLVLERLRRSLKRAGASTTYASPS